jgi:hypothetical protein
VNVHPHDVVPEPTGTTLDDPVDESGDTKNSKEPVPKPQNEENLKKKIQVILIISHNLLNNL